MSQPQLHKHARYSSIREEYLEYSFLAKLCSHAWRSERFVEVARSHTDAFGYDVILTCEGVTRHVQLKATVTGGRASSQKVNTNLSLAPSGCVIWMMIDEDSLQPLKLGWFGAEPGAPLPDLGEVVAKHTKGDSSGNKAERFAIREVKKSRFEWDIDIEKTFERLFGK